MTLTALDENKLLGSYFALDKRSNEVPVATLV